MGDWDDTALIRAYDASVASYLRSHAGVGEVEEPSSSSVLGDRGKNSSGLEKNGEIDEENADFGVLRLPAERGALMRALVAEQEKESALNEGNSPEETIERDTIEEDPQQYAGASNVSEGLSSHCHHQTELPPAPPRIPHGVPAELHSLLVQFFYAGWHAGRLA